MFGSLKTESITVPENEKTMISISQEQFDFFIQSIPDLSNNTKVADTKKELAALTVAIESHGLSKSLLAFANHNGILGSVVPEIGALESLSADMTVDESIEIINSLKIIYEKLDVGVERLTWAQWILTILGFFSGLVPGIVLYVAFTVWNDKEGNKNKKRIASVVPYDTIIGYLNAVLELPSILNSLESMALPKTEEEHEAFISKIVSKTNSISKLGVRVSRTGDVTTTDLESPKSCEIEQEGYTEQSLKNIGTLAHEIAGIEGRLKSISFDNLNKQLSAAKGSEKKIMGKAYDLLDDVAYSLTTRSVKVLHLAKQTCSAIEHFYSKG